MKKLFVTILCFCCTSSFAQNGFFVQPEIGAGISNTSWKPQFSTMAYQGQENVLSYQGQIDIGYKAGKWQFVSGIGYLRTGVKVTNSTMGLFERLPLTNMPFDIVRTPENITDYNPHLIIPVKIAYEMLRFNNKLSFTPAIGAEFGVNMPRTFINDPYKPYFNYPEKRTVESQQQFNAWCNHNGVLGILQLNLEYRLNNHCDLTAGPSVQYMYTSELNFKDEHDYAVLMNLGLKWNFKSTKQINTKQIN